MPAPTAQAAPLVATPAVPQGDGTSYEAKGRRDPFMPLDVTGGPKGLEVATTKLTGIVRGANTTLALVEAQDGIGYILKPGDTLGDGRLVEIGIDTVVFAVASRPGAQSNRVVLRLAAN
jgi:Tfp pilus assembly protein PilP